MKNTVYFIPAFIFTVAYSLILIGTGLSVSQIVFACIALFIISGILMAKKLFWGGVFGILPGCYLMYMSTVDTGQIMNVELPLGDIVVSYYLVCSIYIFVRRKKLTDKS